MTQKEIVKSSNNVVGNEDEQIAELQKNEVRLTANFNYKPLLAKYDLKAVESSVIQYYEAVLSVTDEIMNGNKNSAAKSKTYSKNNSSVCADCGTSISQKVADYSKAKFGKCLCYDCQHSHEKVA